MFNLKRILNSGKCAPEPVRLPVLPGETYRYGTALTLSDGALVNCSSAASPLYVAAQSLNAGGAETMLVFPVSDRMIFETEISEAPASLSVGSKVTLQIRNGSAVGVTATTAGGVATIFSLLCAKAAGDTVLVTF